MSKADSIRLNAKKRREAFGLEGKYANKEAQVDIVDKIMTNQKYDDGQKLIKLYSLVMLYYRQPMGDRAWEGIGKLFKSESLVRGFSFLTGFILGSEGKIDTKRFKEFIKDDL